MAAMFSIRRSAANGGYTHFFQERFYLPKFDDKYHNLSLNEKSFHEESYGDHSFGVLKLFIAL